MAGQLCGRCGGFRTEEGCACPPGPNPPLATDPPTEVIPALGGPALVRPYINPADLVPDEDADPAGPHPYESSVVPGIDAPHVVRSSRARVLAGQLVVLPGQRGAEPVPFRPGGRSLAVRDAGANGGTDEPGRRGPARRVALIAAGALAVAGLGTAAALAPRLLQTGDDNQAKPQPGVTLALPTAAPDPEPTHSASAAAVRATTAHPSSTHTRARPSATPSATHTRSATAAATPPPKPTASPTPSAARQTLQLGDSGADVATLQSELVALWVNHDLPVSGTYDQATQRAVATFQWWYGVTADQPGVFGPASQAEMVIQMRKLNG